MAEDSNTPVIPESAALDATGSANEVVAEESIASIGETAQDILANDDPVAALTETVAGLPVPEDTMVILQFFEQMDAASPLAQFSAPDVLAGLIVSVFALDRRAIWRQPMCSASRVRQRITLSITESRSAI